MGGVYPQYRTNMHAVHVVHVLAVQICTWQTVKHTPFTYIQTCTYLLYQSLRCTCVCVLLVLQYLWHTTAVDTPLMHTHI